MNKNIKKKKIINEGKNNVKNFDIDLDMSDDEDLKTMKKELETIDNLGKDEILDEAKNNYIENELKEQVIKFFKFDDQIKIKQEHIRRKKAELAKKLVGLNEDIKSLKDQQKDLENFLIRYLDSTIDEEKEKIINNGDRGKLIKNISVRKGAIKVDVIKDSIQDILKKNKLVSDDKLSPLLEEIINNIEGKRDKKEKVYMKRTIPKKYKENLFDGKIQLEGDNGSDESDEEITISIKNSNKDKKEDKNKKQNKINTNKKIDDEIPIFKNKGKK